MRSLVLIAAAVIALSGAALAADEASRTADAKDESGQRTGSVTVERAGEPWTAEGKTFAPFSVVVRNAGTTAAHFFGKIALDGGKAGDCTWYALVDSGSTKRIEKACKQRRAWSEFEITAKTEVPRVRTEPTPTPTPLPFVP